MDDEKRFKRIPGYEREYKICETGEIISIPRKGNERKHMILSPFKNRDGYVKVGLRKNNTLRQYFIHRLIAELFIPNEYNKPEVDHINGIRDDNRVENLRWVTHKENTDNPISRNKLADAANRRSIVVNKYDLDGVFICSYKSIREAARSVGILSGAISNCIKRKTHIAGGYLWYLDEN